MPKSTPPSIHNHTGPIHLTPDGPICSHCGAQLCLPCTARHQHPIAHPSPTQCPITTKSRLP
jgi:hypothetical protein